VSTIRRIPPAPWRGPPLDARLNLVVAQEDADALAHFARRHGRSVSGEVRMAIYAHLARYAEANGAATREGVAAPNNVDDNLTRTGPADDVV
jgi:hypothetical protein